MADDMKLQIILEGVNDATPAFDALNRSMEGLKTLADDLSRVLGNFLKPLMEDARSVATAFEQPSKQASEQLSHISEGLSGISKVAEESANAVAKDYENAAKKAEEAIANVGKHGSSGGKGGHGGLFGMQGQMDTMYAGMALGGMAAPLDLGIKDAIKTYGDFSQAVANVNSMMGLTPPEVQKLSDQLVELSKTAPAGPTELANALYGIVGAGVPASDAMDVLKTSAEAATAGQTDVSTATSALISVMDSYGLKGKDVAKIADQMFAANAAGAMTFDQFAKSIGTVAGPAAQAGVGFGEVAAATAALTNQGISAQRATEGLRALMMGIMAPTHGAQQEAHKLGIEWDQNALKQKGLAGMMQEAMKATGGNSQELKKLIPNIAAWTVAVDLGGKGAESYKQAMDTMSQSAGATGRALQAQEQGFTEQMNHMKNSVQAAQIAFVQGFAPVLTSVADDVTKLMQSFQKLSPETQKIIGYIALGAAGFLTLGSAMFMSISAIGGIVSGVKAIAGAFALLEFNPVILAISAVVAAVAVAAYEIYTHWGQIKTWLENTWNAIKTSAESIWNGIKDFFSQLWTETAKFFSDSWTSIKNAASDIWNSIKQTASDAWNGLINGIKDLWNGFKTWVVDTTTAIANGVVDGFKWLYNHNYYFKDLVDFVVQRWENLKNNTLMIWDAIKNALTTSWNWIKDTSNTVWTGIKTFFSTTWDAIKTTASTTWNAIKSVLTTLWQDLVNGVNIIWNPIKTFFSDLWNGISSTSSSMWSSITSTLSGLWNSAVQDAESIWNGLGNWFSDLWNEAEQWGENLIHMFAQGIENAAISVWDSVKSIGSTISNLLGFHSPTKEGEGKDADTWAPNFMKMFVSGMNDGLPDVKNAVHDIAYGIYQYLGFHSPTEQGPASDADQWAPNFIDMLSKGLLDGVPKVKDAVSQVAQTIKDAIDQMIQQISDDMKKISDVSTTTASSLQSAFTSAFDTIAQKAQSTLQQVQQAIQQMQSSIQQANLSAPGISTGGGGMNNADVGSSGVTQNSDGSYTYNPSQDTSFQDAISSIPAFANGGRVTKPTLAWVGEKESETIIPDSFFRNQSGFTMGLSGMSGGSGVNITVNVTGNITRNEQELGDIVSRAIWNKMKLQGRF